ncbi:MAG: FHA domain-containing protein [Fimbriimonadales bacterium]|nr:FHA domain-containing protein [Fimbriimonadales bacterium]
MSDEPVEQAAQTEAEPKARLVLKRSGAETEVDFVVRPPAVVGRFDPDVGPIDIDLGLLPEGVYVSRRHARVELEGGVWRIADLGSSNGTFLLNPSTGQFERVQEAEVSDGAELAFGNVRFVFRVERS